MITPFIALLFLPPIALRETKPISNTAHILSRILESLAKLSNILVLSRVYNAIDVDGKKRKRNKEYNQTRSLFYIRCN